MVVSFSTVCGISFLHKILCIIEINKCLVAKILLTNVTKTNEHSNVATLVDALVGTIIVGFAKYASYCGLSFVDKRHTMKSTKNCTP